VLADLVIGRDVLGLSKLLLPILAVFAATGCGRSAGASSGGSASSSNVLNYSFAGIEGEVVSTNSNLGRVTVLLFVTTFDVSSQAQAKRLEDLYRTHVPRLNAVAIVVEAPRHVELARSFRDVLDLHFPVAMTEQRTLSRHPVLSGLPSIPAWVFLDRRGNLTGSAWGARTPQELDEAVARAEEGL